MISRRHFLSLLPAGLLTGCPEEKTTPRPVFPKVPWRVCATTPFAADFAGIVGGKAVQVQSILPAGLSPELFVPGAPDIAKLRTSDLVITHGLGLERRWGVDFEEMAKSGVRVFSATSRIPAERILHPSGPGSAPDPHVWTNPELASLMLDAVEAAFKEVMPDAGSYFAKRAYQIRVKLQETASNAKIRAKEIKPENRFLFTSHDGLRYFADAYSLETKALTAADGVLPEHVPDAVVEWVHRHHIRYFFREPSADLNALRRMFFEIKMDPGIVIHTLTLPPPDTTEVTAYKTYEVGSTTGALHHLCEIILTKLGVG